MAKAYVWVSEWSDINWCLQEGGFFQAPTCVVFPGFCITDLDPEKDKDAFRKMILDARKDGIKITCNEEDLLEKLELPPVKEDDLKLLSDSAREKVLKTEIDPSDPNADRKLQLEKCNEFFLKVAERMKETHVVLGSAIKAWGSACLIPKGTENQLSYYGKPINSLRVACNWNWRANLKRCSVEDYIQCATNDLPWPMRRPANNPEGASKPIWGNMVGYFGKDNRYHCVYGERFDRKTKTWDWVEGDADEVVRMMLKEAEPVVKAAEPIAEYTSEEKENEV